MSNTSNFSNISTSTPLRMDHISLIIIIVSCIYILLYLFISKRILALLLSFIINQFLRRYSTSLFFSSISFSPLSGRIILYGFRYITESYSIQTDVIVFQLNWRLLVSSEIVKNAFIHVTIRNLHYHLFYRQETYSKLRQLFKRNKQIPEQQSESQNSNSVSNWFPQLYKISFDVRKGHLVFGNETVPAYLVFRFKSADGSYSIEPTDTLDDLYKYVFEARTKSMNIFLVPTSKLDSKSPFLHVTENENLFLETNAFVIKYQSDEPGIATNLDLPPPEYSLSVWISHDSHLYYSPWSNQLRLLLQRLFFPWDFTTRPMDQPEIGKKRLFERFLVKFRILEDSTNKIHSKFYIHLGFHDTNANKFPTSLIDITMSTDSSLTIDYPWRELEDGHTPEIKGVLTNLHIFSPTFSLLEFAEIKKLDFCLSMHFPRRWNGLQTWKYNFNVEHTRINFVFSHLDFFDALLDDWNKLPEQPADIETFVPLDWQIEANFNCYQIFTFLNQYNWIDNRPGTKNNTQLAFVGKRGRICVQFPFTEHHPLRQTISFTVLGEEMIGRLFIPHSLSVRNSILCLSQCNNDKWSRPLQLEACTDCIVDSHLGDANEDAWLTLGSGPYLFIKSTFTYTPETHREQVKLDIPNNLQIFVDITDLYARFYGSLITVLLNLKDNYPGEYQNLQPYTQDGPGIPYGGILTPGKLKPSHLEVELVFNLKQAFLELPKYPNPWENDPPLLPAIYIHLLEISFYRTLRSSNIRVITEPIFVISPSSKQKCFVELDMGFGFCEGLEFYGHSMTGETAGEWQEYAWLTEVKLGDIHANCSLSHLSEIISWLEITVNHALAKGDDLSFPKYLYCPGYNNVGDSIPGNKLKYQFVVFNICAISVTLYQDGVSLLVNLPGVNIDLCNLHTCASSHGLTVLIPSIIASVLIPSAQTSDWIEVGYLNTGQVLIQSELNQITNLNIEKQREFLAEADVSKDLWFLYPGLAKKDDEGRIVCGCKGGCFFFGRSGVSKLLNWLPHLPMARDSQHGELSEHLDSVLPPIGNISSSFSNLNSTFIFLYRFYTRNRANRTSDSESFERFLSLTTAESLDISETLSFRSAFSHVSSVSGSRMSVDSNAGNSDVEKEGIQEGILSEFDFNVKTIHSLNSFHLSQMVYEIRKIRPAFFPDAKNSLYQTPIDTLTLSAHNTNVITPHQLVFSMTNFTQCKTSRITCFPTDSVPTPKYNTTSANTNTSQVKVQVYILDNVHIHVVTSIFKAILTLCESVQDVLIAPHPLLLLDKVKNECLSNEGTKAQLVNLSDIIPSTLSIGIFRAPSVNFYFTLVRNSPIFHHIDSRISSEEKHRCVFYSFISIVLSPSLVQLQISTHSNTRKHITSLDPDVNLLTNESIQAGFHVSILSLFLQSGLLYSLSPDYTIENVYQAFEHIPHKQTRHTKDLITESDQLMQLSQFEAGLDEIMVTGFVKDRNDKELKFVERWWLEVSHTNNLNGSFDARSCSFWFNLPCPRDIDLIKRHIAPSWITTLILFIDQIQTEILPILKLSNNLLESRISGAQNVFISLASICLGSWQHKNVNNPLFDDTSKFIRSTLISEFLDTIQSILLRKPLSLTLQHIPGTLSRKFKQKIIDSIIAEFICNQISANTKSNVNDLSKLFNSVSQRGTLFSLFSCFNYLFSHLNFKPNNYKTELTSFNVYLQIRDVLVLISSPPQGRSRVLYDSPPLLSIQPFISTIKIVNNSPLCRIPRYHSGPSEEPQHRIKLQIRSTLRISKLAIHFETQDMILIYSSILGLNTHLSTIWEEPQKQTIISDTHQHDTNTTLGVNTDSWQECTDHWVQLVEQCKDSFHENQSISLPTLPSKDNFIFSSLQDSLRYHRIDASDVESGSSASNASTRSNYTLLSEEENHINLFFILHIDDTMIFSPDEVNFNLSFQSVTFSTLIKGNFKHSHKHLSLREDFTGVITIGLNEGKLQITDSDTQAELLFSYLSPVHGLAMITLKNGYKKYGLIPSLENLHYLVHLNLTDLNLSVLRPPDLLFDSISKISLKLVHDISILVNSYKSLALESSKNTIHKRDSIVHSPLFFHDRSLPFNLPSGSILLDFRLAILKIEALESISLQYEFNGFIISLNTAPQNMRLSVIIDKHVIVALSKITGKPYDTLDIPKIKTSFEVKSLKPITFIPELSIQSINLHFSVDLINQITALVVAYLYEIRNLYYELKPYLPKTSYETSTIVPQSDSALTFSILDLLHSVKIHLDPINVSLTSSPGLSMRFTTTTLDINIKNPNSFIYTRNKIQSGKFILIEKIQVDISLSLAIALAPQQEPCYEIAYFRTSIRAEDSISSDIHENIGDLSTFVEYPNSKHLFLLTILNPHLFLPTFAMENIFTYIIHWHGGYLYWQKQIRYHEYIAETHTPTPLVKTHPDRLNQAPAFFDFFSSTIFMITVNDLGVCIPVTYQPRLTSNVPLHVLLCTVASMSVSALFGKKSGASGTLKDFRIGFQSQFNPNRKLWSISNQASRMVNSGCIEQGTCKLCLAYSLDDSLQGKRDRIEIRFVFDMAGFDSHMDSGIGYYVSALVKSITNLASGIEAIHDSGYDSQGIRLNYIPEETSERTRMSSSGNSEFRHSIKPEGSVQRNNDSIHSVSDKEFSSLVSDTIRNTPSLVSSIDGEDQSIEDEVIHRKQDDFVGFLQGIDLDVSVSIRIAHGRLLIDSTERSPNEGERKIYKRYVSYPSFYSPGFASDASSDEASGTEYSQNTFTDSSTLYIPGLDISVHFESSIQSENKFVSGSESSAMNASAYAKSHTARLHALVMIRSVPKEMRILPALVEFLDKIAQPISNFAQSASFLSGPATQTEHQQNIFTSYTQSYQFFPIDVLVSIQLQPLVVKLTCLPLSRVEAILQTPQIETMCSFTIYKQKQGDFQSSYSCNLLKSYLNKKDMLNICFITDINLTFYLSKLSLSVSSYLVTKHEEVDLAKTRDALRIQLDRAKINLFRRKTNYSLDMGYSTLPASTVDLSLVGVIGKLFFKFDMRRLTDVATFRKCWYRQGLMNLVFLGANLANVHPSETKPPKVKEVEEIESASIILFCLQICECEVKCNLAELMGDCNLNSKALGINGYIGHQGQKLLLLSLKVLVDDARFFANSGVIAGHTELNNANIYVKLFDCQNLPSHEFSLDVSSFDGRLKYMGLTVLTFETNKIKTYGRDSWKQTSGNLTLKLHVDIEWEMFRMMLTRSTFDSILKIFDRLQKFVEDQRQRSRKMLTRLLPPDGPPVLVSFVAKMDNEKQIERPIKKIFSISWLWAVKKGVFKLIEHLGFNLSQQSDLHLGGNVKITGGGFAIAFSPSDNFLVDSWTVIAIKELLVNFNTDAIPGLILEQQECSIASFANRICQQSFHIELGYQKNGKDLEEKAGVYKVVRTKGPVPPIDSPNSEWLDYACIEFKLGITGKQKTDKSPKYKIKLSPIPILSFPSFYIDLITDHFCSYKEDSADFESRVECNFDSNFFGEVAVTTNVDLYLFLHDLFKCYIDKLKSISEKQGVKQQKDESGQIFVDSRTFKCAKWHLEPMLNVMSMVSWGSGSVNPHIDWLLDKLSLNKARTTIPKCIQRGAMDPIDHLISLFIRKILLFSAGKKSFSDFQ